MQTLKFLFKTFSITFLGIYLLYVGYIYFNQTDMVFRASKLPKNHTFTFNQNFEEISINSFDNSKLNALLFKKNNPKGVILYLHGNAGNLDGWGQQANTFDSIPYDVLMLDYRGFGKSEENISNQEQLYKDLSCVYTFLLSKYNKSNIIIIGYSIGTGLATYLASIQQPKMLILQAPYYNFTDFTSKIVPYFPNFLKKFSFPSNEYFKSIKCPIIIFHGKDDKTIPVENSLELKKLFKAQDQLYILENQDHIGMNENIEFRKKLEEILQ